MVTRTIWYRNCEFIIYPPSRDAPRAMPPHSTEGEAINEAMATADNILDEYC